MNGSQLQTEISTFACLQSLPSANILRARCQKCSSDNERRRSRSVELERKYKKIVSLCTGVGEGKVEGLLDGLVKVVESEGRGCGSDSRLSAEGRWCWQMITKFQ